RESAFPGGSVIRPDRIFHIRNVPPGEYFVKASAPDWNTASKLVTMESGQSVTVTLQLSRIKIPPKVPPIIEQPFPHLPDPGDPIFIPGLNDPRGRKFGKGAIPRFGPGDPLWDPVPSDFDFVEPPADVMKSITDVLQARLNDDPTLPITTQNLRLGIKKD